ncbi:hypothetical protein GPECTOR_19g316 [Gonium pectorale]|uniref:Polymerase nucleotidyl transferase domain-containing protein n=1 Tax=Gonium pectorale TaxID=33097 RepID=A0A150GJK8_GONPE|nr:hypothetical protein GPECTOR_19g316 [Gonium pectorale]|eukprot:KXZ49865.1 hypothetical protein GPECTOR_19g316 [Gonium pectorale]
MPPLMRDKYASLQREIQAALDEPFRAFQSAARPEVVLDGSLYKGTALEGSSDADLVVRTAFPVPRRLKRMLHRFIQLHLNSLEGWVATLVPKRKSAAIECEVEEELEGELLDDGGEEQELGGCSRPPAEPDSDLEMRLECALQVEAHDGGGPAPRRYHLSADLLFENATVGQPLSPIVNPFEGQEAARLAVMAIKLFQVKARSLARLKGYCVEAMVRHVVTDYRPPSRLTAGDVAPTESVAQALILTLGLFRTEPHARSLDERVWRHSSVRSGPMYDEGIFLIWKARAGRLIRDLKVLAAELEVGQVGGLEPAVERLRSIIEPPVAASKAQPEEPGGPVPGSQPDAEAAGADAGEDVRREELAEQVAAYVQRLIGAMGPRQSGGGADEDDALAALVLRRAAAGGGVHGPDRNDAAATSSGSGGDGDGNSGGSGNANSGSSGDGNSGGGGDANSGRGGSGLGKGNADGGPECFSPEAQPGPAAQPHLEPSPAVLQYEPPANLTSTYEPHDPPEEPPITPQRPAGAVTSPRP